MTLGDFHNLFIGINNCYLRVSVFLLQVEYAGMIIFIMIGRMGPNGNEYEVRHVVERMATILHERYPNTIASPSHYLTCSNKDKLVVKPSSNPPPTLAPVTKPTLVAVTVLTPEAKKLCTALNLNSALPDELLLSEFRSRVTYLAFPKVSEGVKEAKEYMPKMVHQFGHLSVLAAAQVAIHLPSAAALTLASSSLAKFIKTSGSESLLVLSLKALRSALSSGANSDGLLPSPLDDLLALAKEKFGEPIF